MSLVTAVGDVLQHMSGQNGKQLDMHIGGHMSFIDNTPSSIVAPSCCALLFCATLFLLQQVTLQAGAHVFGH